MRIILKCEGCKLRATINDFDTAEYLADWHEKKESHVVRRMANAHDRKKIRKMKAERETVE